MPIVSDVPLARCRGMWRRRRPAGQPRVSVSRDRHASVRSVCFANQLTCVSTKWVGSKGGRSPSPRFLVNPLDRQPDQAARAGRRGDLATGIRRNEATPEPADRGDTARSRTETAVTSIGRTAQRGRHAGERAPAREEDQVDAKSARAGPRPGGPGNAGLRRHRPSSGRPTAGRASSNAPSRSCASRPGRRASRAGP
jgi:hypothetical protein